MFPVVYIVAETPQLWVFSCFLYAQRNSLFFFFIYLFFLNHQNNSAAVFRLPPIAPSWSQMGQMLHKNEIFKGAVGAKCASISGKCCEKTLLHYTYTLYSKGHDHDMAAPLVQCIFVPWKTNYTVFRIDLMCTLADSEEPFCCLLSFKCS